MLPYVPVRRSVSATANGSAETTLEAYNSIPPTSVVREDGSVGDLR